MNYKLVVVHGDVASLELTPLHGCRADLGTSGRDAVVPRGAWQHVLFPWPVALAADDENLSSWSSPPEFLQKVEVVGC